MPTEIITKEDLESFRVRLLNDLKQLQVSVAQKPTKEWLKGAEVRKMLNISAGTLQNLRITGKLQSTKVGGIYFYRYRDIEKLFQQ
ncbi:MAG: helix-turn-helix domain-containing protein [Bacteroidetes bacterium]|nr:helix-turn-helix domain-containing protein [Bacteroidota bacterium]